MAIAPSPTGPHLLAAIGANLLLAAAAVAAPAQGGGGVPALYATQAEAEQAARTHFNCTGAHRMGNQWMACAKHGSQGSGQHNGQQAGH